MASIGTETNGHRRILFVARDGSRKTIRLGKTSQRQAEAFKVKVEQLIAAAILGHPADEETSRWLAGRDDVIHARLAAVGLVKSRRDSEVAQKVLDACPDAEWRLLFALSRFGGLRCPSEHLLLTWADIDWERSQIRVTSPKTEQFEGQTERIIPMFPELRSALLDVFEQA